MEENKKIKSPCLKVCHLDLRSGYCKGCKRTIDEIRRWPSMSDEEKQDILNALTTRIVPSQLS